MMKAPRKYKENVKEEIKEKLDRSASSASDERRRCPGTIYVVFPKYRSFFLSLELLLWKHFGQLFLAIIFVVLRLQK